MVLVRVGGKFINTDQVAYVERVSGPEGETVAVLVFFAVGWVPTEGVTAPLDHPRLEWIRLGGDEAKAMLSWAESEVR
jgi:hypothetical protein